MECDKCGANIFDVASRGVYLKRRNALGDIGIFTCEPQCGDECGDQDSALIAAMEDSKPTENPLT